MSHNTAKFLEIAELHGKIQAFELVLDMGYVHVGPCVYQELDKHIIVQIEEQIEQTKSRIAKLFNSKSD